LRMSGIGGSKPGSYVSTGKHKASQDFGIVIKSLGGREREGAPTDIVCMG